MNDAKDHCEPAYAPGTPIVAKADLLFNLYIYYLDEFSLTNLAFQIYGSGLI